MKWLKSPENPETLQFFKMGSEEETGIKKTENENQ